MKRKHEKEIERGKRSGKQREGKRKGKRGEEEEEEQEGGIGKKNLFSSEIHMM